MCNDAKLGAEAGSLAGAFVGSFLANSFLSYMQLEDSAIAQLAVSSVSVVFGGLLGREAGTIVGTTLGALRQTWSRASPAEALRDCYELMKLSPASSVREIDMAFRRLAIKFHPVRLSTSLLRGRSARRTKAATMTT